VSALFSGNAAGSLLSKLLHTLFRYCLRPNNTPWRYWSQEKRSGLTPGAQRRPKVRGWQWRSSAAEATASFGRRVRRMLEGVAETNYIARDVPRMRDTAPCASGTGLLPWCSLAPVPVAWRPGVGWVRTWRAFGLRRRNKRSL